MPSKEIPLTDAQRKLVEDNLNLIHWFLQRQGTHPSEYDDKFQICSIGMMQAARAFDPARGKFSSLAVRQMGNVLRQEWRRSNATRRRPPGPMLSLQSPPRKRYAGRDSEGVVNLALQDMIADPTPPPDVQYEQSQLNDAARYILDSDNLLYARFSEELTQTEIARECGVSQAAISRQLRQRLNMARTAIEKYEGGTRA